MGGGGKVGGMEEFGAAETTAVAPRLGGRNAGEWENPGPGRGGRDGRSSTGRRRRADGGLGRGGCRLRGSRGALRLSPGPRPPHTGGPGQSALRSRGLTREPGSLT